VAWSKQSLSELNKNQGGGIIEGRSFGNEHWGGTKPSCPEATGKPDQESRCLGETPTTNQNRGDPSVVQNGGKIKNWGKRNQHNSGG